MSYKSLIFYFVVGKEGKKEKEKKKDVSLKVGNSLGFENNYIDIVPKWNIHYHYMN